MRILVVTAVPPWPTVTGAQMRLANVIEGLRRVGEVDLFVLLGRSPWDVLERPPNAPVRRVGAAHKPERRWSWPARAVWLVRGGLPIEFLGRDYRQVRAKFRVWARDGYDLVWVNRVECYVALGASPGAPTVVDLDDLEDHKAAARLQTTSGRNAAVPAVRIRRVVSRIQSARNVYYWRRLQLAVARAVDAVVVCSDLDRRRLGVGNVVVVPNGYRRSGPPVGRVEVGDPPVIAFVGFLPYGPNCDAATYLARTIAPLVRARIPNVQVRLVGYADDRVVRLHDPPRVVVTGYVPDVVTELRAADVLAVPVRFGGGTRIKILEGFAHRIPVVATSVGAEGIEATDGVEILLRDDPQRFAEACVTLLRDRTLRRALSDAAHALFEERYRWEPVQEKVAALAAAVASGGAVAGVAGRRGVGA